MEVAIRVGVKGPPYHLGGGEGFEGFVAFYLLHTASHIMLIVGLAKYRQMGLKPATPFIYIFIHH